MTGMTLNVDENLVKPIIEAEIQAAIVRQLESGKNLIPKLVQAALNQKVDSNGKVSSRGYSDEVPYIEWLCTESIQKAAKTGMEKFIADSAPIIQAEVEKQIRAQSKDIAKAFVEGLAAAVKVDWRFTLKIEVPQRN